MTDAELEQKALDDWKSKNSWSLSRDDFIKLSYFHGCIEAGSDGKGPINGFEDRPGDVVYVSPSGGALTRAMVSHWYSHCNAFVYGYTTAYRAAEAELILAEPTP